MSEAPGGLSGPAQPPEPTAPAPKGPGQQGLTRLLRRPWALVLLLLLLLLGGWQWYQSYSRMNALREELAMRLRDSDADSREARLLARQAQEAVRELQARLTQVETKLTESQNQQVALEALYQELARNRDEWALAEVEQILDMASQQLQLAGNVRAALVGLETAEQRLARSDRPQFIPLRKVLARDQEKLKTTPNLDLAGLALKIDQVIDLIDTLPLAGEERVAASSLEPLPQQGFWRRLGADIWSELKSLVRIEISDAADPGLLAPNQAFFLRENLKLRLLNARLALLSRDEHRFREDLKAASAWLARWFDARSKASQAAQAALRQLSSADIQIEVPTISDSLNAVRNYKLSRDKAR